MFRTRLISGIVLLAIALFTMSMGNIWLLGILLLISFVAYRELSKALGFGASGAGIGALEATGYLGVAAFYGAAWYVAIFGGDLMLLLTCIMGVFMLQLFVYVFAFPRYQAGQVMAAFFSFLYAPVMLSFVFLTRELRSGNGFYLVWLILISSWGCDTCAYVVGKLIGRKRIFPVLSPHKSLEGCIGGVLGAGLIGALYGYFLVERAFPDRSVTAVIALISALGAVMSMVGDLAASGIKRNHDIKDYGKLIPGHGGIMDRFDSMIVTAPMVYLLAYWLL